MDSNRYEPSFSNSSRVTFACFARTMSVADALVERCLATLAGPCVLADGASVLSLAPRGATSPVLSAPALLYFFHPHLANCLLYMRALIGLV